MEENVNRILFVSAFALIFALVRLYMSWRSGKEMGLYLALLILALFCLVFAPTILYGIEEGHLLP